MMLARGDLIVHDQAGGGGFGDPLTRDPERVRRDVWNDKISAEYALRRHGVLIEPRSRETAEITQAGNPKGATL
jgi:N-methylhydantoinase B